MMFSRELLEYACGTIGFEYAILWQLSSTGSLVASTKTEGGISESMCRLRELQSNELQSTGLADPMDAIENQEEHIQFASGVGMPGKVLKTGEPVWLSNVQDEKEGAKELPQGFVRRKVAIEAGINTVFCVPKEDGVVEFGSKRSLERDENIIAAVRMCFDEPGGCG